MGLRPRLVIEISTDHLKVVLGTDRGSSGFRVTACDVRDISGLSDDDIALRLKEMLSAVKASHRAEVVAIIPRQHAIMRLFDFPSFDHEEISRMVDLQAFQHVPYARAEAVSDFAVIVEGKGFSKVMVVIVPRDIFMRHWSIYRKAGRLPGHVTISSEGIASWAGLSGLASNVNVVFDVQETVGEICVSDGGRLLTSRQIQFPGIDNQVDDLLRQLELTLAAYEKEHLGAGITKTIILASADRAEHLLREGRNTLRHVFEVVGFVGKIPVSKTLAWPKAVVEGRVSVLAACGLAWTASAPSIQLMALDMRAIQDRRHLMVRWVRACLCLGIALLTFGWAVSVPLLQKNKGLDSLNEELKSLKAKVSRVQAQADQIDAIEAVLARKIKFAQVIKELYALMPSGLILSNFSISPERKMAIEGYSLDRDMVDAFQKAMGQAEALKDVKLEYINKRVMQVGEVNYFEITCRMADAYEKTHK